MISIVMDSNERGTDRHVALAEYITRHPDEYDFSFGDVEVDLIFSIGAEPEGLEAVLNPGARRKVRAVELKMPSDFVQSLQNGHLSQQRRQCPYPLQVAVMGSLGDVLRALPKVTGKGWRNPRERMQAEAMIRRGVARLKASGADVSFGESPLDYVDFSGKTSMAIDYIDVALKANMAQVVREARAYLESDIHLPRPKAESWQEYALCGLPGVGPERARAMLEARFGIELQYWGGPANDIQLVSVPGIGKKTAAKIMEAMR